MEQPPFQIGHSQLFQPEHGRTSRWNYELNFCYCLFIKKLKGLKELLFDYYLIIKFLQLYSKLSRRYVFIFDTTEALICA